MIFNIRKNLLNKVKFKKKISRKLFFKNRKAKLFYAPKSIFYLNYWFFYKRINTQRLKNILDILFIVTNNFTFLFKKKLPVLYKNFSKNNYRWLPIFNVKKYIISYLIYFNILKFDFFFFHKSKFFLKKYFNKYDILWNFKKNKLFLSIIDEKKKIFSFFSSGFFSNYLNQKKSFKKTKNLKIYIIKFFRKIILLSNIKNINLIIKSIPVNFEELLKFFLIPTDVTFLNPINNSYMLDNFFFLKLKIHFVFFYKTIKFSKNKEKKKKTLKRKIQRKIFKINKIKS